MMNAPSVPESVNRIARAVARRGGRALVVGGGVRDSLLGEKPKDFDVEVYGIPVGEVPSVLGMEGGHVLQVGRSFPVWKVWSEGETQADAIDVAVPRRERKTGQRHTDFSVEADERMSFAEAAGRRDFTVNAIMFDPLSGEIIDPADGVRDIAAKRLRHVSSRFAEDPLRVLRGMQFAARFDFDTAPETIRLCRSLTPDGLSRERLWGEWQKVIAKGKRPSRALQFLADTGWDKYTPEIRALRGVPQDPRWHPEGDAWVHTGHCLDAFAQRRTGDAERDQVVGFAVLCHDFGKATHTTQINGRWTSHGHEAAGRGPTEAFLYRLTDQTGFVHRVRALVVEHMNPKLLFNEARRNGDDASMDAAVRRLAVRLSQEGATIEDLCLVCECDTAGRPPLPASTYDSDWLRSRARAAKAGLGRPPALLMGRDLIGFGLVPGPSFKEILGACYEQQLAGAITTREEALEFARGHAGVAPLRLPPIPVPSLEPPRGGMEPGAAQ